MFKRGLPLRTGIMTSGRRHQWLLVLLVLALSLPPQIVILGAQRITAFIRRRTPFARNTQRDRFGTDLSAYAGERAEAFTTQFDQMSTELRESYAALKEREERLALVVAGTNDGIWDMNLITNEAYLSPRGKEMLGYQDHEFIASHEAWERLIHPDDVELMRTEMEACLAGQIPICRVEIRVRHKDGSYRWILARGTVLRDADSKPYRIAGSHTDITERKQAEEALRQSEKRFSQIFHASPVPTMMTAPLNDGRFVEVNEAWLRLMGYTRAEVIGQTALELHTWAEPEQRLLMIRQLQATGSVRNEEYLARTKSGEQRNILLSAEVLELSKQPYILYYVYDITERKQAEEALWQSEKRFSQAFHASPVPIIMTSPLDDGRVVEVNDAWLRLMGYTRAEAIGKSAMELNTWAEPEQRSLMKQQLKATGSVRNMEYLARTRSGELRNVLLSAEVLELNSQRYALYYVYDITERKRAEEALWQSEKRFSQAFHTSPVPCVILALADGRYLEVNEAWLRLFGFTRAEAIGNTSLGLQIWADPEDRAEFYRKLESNDAVHGEEYLARIKSGEVRTVLLSAEPLELNSQSYLLCFIHDITEVKHTQQALERRVAERTHDLAALNEIAAIVSRSLDLEEILNAALNKAMEIMWMEVGAAYCLQENGDQTDDKLLVLAAQQGLSAEFSQRAGSWQVQGTAIQTAGEAGLPEIRLVSQCPDLQMRQALELESVRQYIHVPLLSKGKLVGAFNLGTRGEREIEPEELSLLASIGRQIGLAVENGILYNQAEQSAAIAERQRLSRELHDSVTQSLYSVTMYAEAAARLLDVGDTATAADHLRELRDTSQEALREMRLLIFELRPLALEQIGLVAALQARLDSVEARGGSQTELQVDGVQTLERLPRLVEEELYHIAQEALNNALKHSRARHIRVHLHFADSETLLEICDDGVGFNQAAAENVGGLGLASLKERAHKIGAALSIDSAPGSGTKIRVAVPTKERHPGMSA